MTLPRVMLADDHTILVEAFRKLLEPHFEIVGSVADGRALLSCTSTQTRRDCRGHRHAAYEWTRSGVEIEGTDARSEAHLPDDE